MIFRFAQRNDRMQASAIREILKVSERPGIISLAGGMPAPESFPVDELRQACERVLREEGRSALQYSASEGLPALREWLAQDLRQQGLRVAPEQILVTTGSQQGLDLLGKVLIDAGSTVLVESPTYLGALQAFAPMEPAFRSVASDGQGALPGALAAQAAGARFAYLIPSFQNPTGRCMDPGRREELAQAAARAGLPLVEDNPYGELWFEQAPPPPLAALYPEGTAYLGSLSKVLAPGLRLGCVAAPPALRARLLRAKQAADLHTPTFNQRLALELLRSDFLARHLPPLRQRYRAQCQAMLAALERRFGHAGEGGEHSLSWNRPQGGMFIWARLPAGLDAQALLPRAIEQGLAYVPGSAFYAQQHDARSLRLSFVTASVADIERGVGVLAQVVQQALRSAPA